MKYFSFTIFLIIVSQYVYAEGSEDYLGEFVGSEDVVITCDNSSWNWSGNRPWKVKHTEVNGNSYKGIIQVYGGKYAVDGTINGTSATGTFDGKDKFGNSCSGTFSNTLDGDQLKGTGKGNCPASKCEFEGNITATRK